MARILVLLLVAGLVVLIFYLHLVVAFLFIALVTLLAIVRGAAGGFWIGFGLFLKEVLFGW